MERITRSVPIFANVEMVTESMEWTAEQRWCPDSGAQFADTGVHQNAMRNIWRRKVPDVIMQAAKSEI